MRWLVNALLAAALPIAQPAASPVCTPRADTPVAALAAAGSKRLTSRASELTFTSGAMNGPVRAVVILPAGYAANPAARYPVLYLLHGHGGSGHMDWPNHGVEAVVGTTPVIVVIPEGGYDGYYSDWYGTDIDGHTPSPPPAWETFHIRELIPWIDAHYRTRSSRLDRAIAGNSMGGFGAMSYAARHPDLFVAAGAFSGAVEPLLLWPLGSAANWIAPNVADGQAPDLCIWGDPVTQHVRWQDHDPTALAANLGVLTLYHRSGDGQPGQHDDFAAEPPSPGAVLNEFGIGLMNHDFDRALTQAGIPHTSVFEHGIHGWGYWLDGLRDFLPRAVASFERPVPAPPAVPFDFTSGAATFSVWDWRFRASHPDQASLVVLRRVSRRGLSVSGVGMLRVDTAPVFDPGRTYLVAGRRRVADTNGRLHFTVDLRRQSVRVAIAPAARRGPN